ncbi:M1 family metallopeptidase [Corallococcus sp. M34]|uniref:M1 family metallopeptidase n=1 Tax=Citreicoccus inhibens TaxID=2849499 RepID=UPI001C2475D9|nr:M1 family metallopeptidase [Citreicoccus inhibens]MBU8899449.1 M1 family metallopeptidase [Citreicoccus inhibens]
MRWHLPLLLSVVSIGCAHAPEPAAPTPAPVTAAVQWPEPHPPDLRLADSVRPLHYELDLKLIPSDPTYSGSVTVDLEVREPVRQFWLHAQDLSIGQAQVQVGERTLEAKTVTQTEGRLGVLLPEELPAGHARLTLTFSGHVDRERSQGLYAVEEGGESYLYTFFEPIDARRAFPCFDEPTFKVPWRLRFTVKQGHVALANHPVVSREPLADGLERVTFAESRPMPSYLVAFMVGPFDVVEAGTVGRQPVPLRFIVPKGRGPETRYAASVTPRIVKTLEDFFDQPYPYEKLDVAVVPRYWGTMEHPGIVALGQPITLIRPDEETLRRRKFYVNIAGHELGHYWFGDIVTCKWWDDIWLNESFTSWLDRHTMDGVEPKWNSSQERTLGSLSFALESDALDAVPTVRKSVNSTGDIIGSFDNGTTYAKGSAIIGMFEAWLGPDRMRDVLRAYTRKHAWGVVEAGDFLASLSEAAGPEAALAWRGFVEQPGAPRIAAELECKAGAPAKLKLSQERYLPAGSSADRSRTWDVPVCVRAGTGAKATRTCKLLTAATGEMELPGKGCPKWVLLNAGGTGYYRSGYTREQLARLLAVPSGTFSVTEQGALMADLDAAVGRGDIPLGEALKAVPATALNPSRLVRERGAELLDRVRMDHLTPAERTSYQGWVRSLYGPQARALGWVPKAQEEDETREARTSLLWQAANLGDDPALNQEAMRLAKAWLARHDSVDPDIVQSALMTAARHGDAAFFDALLAEAKRETDRNARLRLLGALGRFREPALSHRALELLLSSDFDARDTHIILVSHLQDTEMMQEAWTYLRDHYDAIMGPKRSDDAGGVLKLLGNLCDDATRSEVEAFLTPRVAKVEGGARELSRALESIHLCIESQHVHQQSVRDFLRAPAAMPSAAKRR